MSTLKQATRMCAAALCAALLLVLAVRVSVTGPVWQGVPFGLIAAVPIALMARWEGVQL